MLDYDIRHGRTYMYLKTPPLYPFGHGLSYTTFRFDGLRTDAPTLRPTASSTVSVDVTNTGKVAGDVVPQVYVEHLGSKVERPSETTGRLQPRPPRAGRDDDRAHSAEGVAAGVLGHDAEGVRGREGADRLLLGESSADIRLRADVDVK